MKRPDSQSPGPQGTPTLSDPAFSGAYPTIWSYLCDSSWDDGKPREVSALSWTIKDGLWQAALNDKALKQSLYSAGPTQKACLKLLEDALANGSGVWRSWKRGK